jgi:hypothetical protein
MASTTPDRTGSGGSFGSGGGSSATAGAGGSLGKGGSAGLAGGDGAGGGAGGGPPSAGGASGATGGTGSSGSACDGGHSLSASDAGSSTPATGYGAIDFKAPMGSQIVGLRTTLLVPAKPTTSTTLYAWPGLEPLPQSANFNPIGQGVLQPVLTWGSSCNIQSPNPNGWWISALYVNPYTTDRAYYGCLGGKPIAVQIGDLLDIDMTLNGTTWSQVVADRQSGMMTKYDIDMMGQSQPWALFRIEAPTSNRPTSDVVFTSTTITFASAESMQCQPTKRGTNDYFAAPQVSVDGTKCCISRMILRAQGVPATSPNGP